MKQRSIRVLVVDDSPLFTEVLSEIIREDPQLILVGTASDGREALALTQSLRPDVITMDVRMPVMDGLEATAEIMAAMPTPILVVTSDPRFEKDEAVFEALRRGALDVVTKPTTWGGTPQEKQTLRERIHLLASIPVTAIRKRRPSRRISLSVAAHTAGRQERLLGIVSSTGGPAALAHILEGLPENFPVPIVIVQHLFPGFAPSLVSWLDGITPLRVKIAQDGEATVSGNVYLAPDDAHLVVNAQGRCVLDSTPALDGHRPSGTKLLSSIAASYGSRSLGLVLTGMGSDGAEGLLAIRRAQGTTLAQDETTSVVYGMPRVAKETGAASSIVALSDIAETLCRLVGHPT